MANFFTDIWNMISSFALVDYILYFAVITLIMLIVSLIYVMREEEFEKLEEQKLEEPKDVVKEPVNDELDLQSIVNTIDENPEPLADMTTYEEEQEKRAIISYDELIKSSQNVINYDKEMMVDDLIPVKKISVQPSEKLPVELIPKEVEMEREQQVSLFTYEKEEEFLKTLQKLNELLNDGAL